VIDPDEALRAYAGRWSDTEPAPPDLDQALVRARRSRRRRRPVLLAAACTLVLAAGLVIATHAHPGSDPATPPSAPTSVSSAELARLRQIAMRAAVNAGDRYASADAVRTTVRRYESLQNGTDPGGADGPIWVIQLHGDLLVDSGWMGPTNPPPPGPYLVFSVAIGHTSTGFDGTSRHAVDLARLGTVVHLLKGRVLAPTIERLRELATTTAANNGDPDAHVEAVRTTYAAADALADAVDPAIADRHPVWLIQISGDFMCNTCRGPGPQPRGHYIAMTVSSVGRGRSTDGFFSLTDTRLDLGRLGRVITLR
jgi:hypothetical protein